MHPGHTLHCYKSKPRIVCSHPCTLCTLESLQFNCLATPDLLWCTVPCALNCALERGGNRGSIAVLVRLAAPSPGAAGQTHGLHLSAPPSHLHSRKMYPLEPCAISSSPCHGIIDINARNQEESVQTEHRAEKSKEGWQRRRPARALLRRVFHARHSVCTSPK